MRSYLVILLSLICLFCMFGCSIKYNMHLYPDNRAYISQTINLSQRYQLYITKSQNSSNFAEYVKQKREEEKKKVDALFHHICEDKENSNRTWKCNVIGFATYRLTTTLPAHNRYYEVRHLGGSHYQLIIHSLPMFPNRTTMEKYEKTRNNTGSQVFMSMNPTRKIKNITPLERYFQLTAEIRVPGEITGVSPSTKGSVVIRNRSVVVLDLNVVRNKFNQSIIINYTTTPQGQIAAYVEEYPPLVVIGELCIIAVLLGGAWLIYTWLVQR